MTVSHWIEVIFRSILCSSKSLYYKKMQYLLWWAELCMPVRRSSADTKNTFQRSFKIFKISKWKTKNFPMKQHPYLKSNSFDPEVLLQHLTGVTVQPHVSNSLFWSRDLRWPQPMLNHVLHSCWTTVMLWSIVSWRE